MKRKSTATPLAPPTPLFVATGCADQRSSYREASSEEVLAAARNLLALRVQRGITIRSYRDVSEYLIHRYSPLEHEVFAIILLDNRHRLIDVRDLFRGTIDGASVHPREVVKEALAVNAAAILCAHCHPSGDPTPSHSDEIITQRLRDALALLDIRLLDHVVVAGDRAESMAALGLI